MIKTSSGVGDYIEVGVDIVEEKNAASHKNVCSRFDVRRWKIINFAPDQHSQKLHSGSPRLVRFQGAE